MDKDNKDGGNIRLRKWIQTRPIDRFGFNFALSLRRLGFDSLVLAFFISCLDQGRTAASIAAESGHLEVVAAIQDKATRAETSNMTM